MNALSGAFCSESSLVRNKKGPCCEGVFQCLGRITTLQPMTTASTSRTSTLVNIARTALLLSGLSQLGCAPQLTKFHVTIPTNPPASQADVSKQQGTTHVCPGTQFQLSWTAKGKASLSAASGVMYQEPLCLGPRKVHANGSETVKTDPQIAPSCGKQAIFRVTASHDFWHWSGSCPGTGCPSADHEVVLEPQSDQRLGGKPADCGIDGFEVTNVRPAVDWDDRVRIGTISVSGPTKEVLTGSTRTLTVTHDGTSSIFSSQVLTSEAFRGQKMSGKWTLRLSGCDASPAVLTVAAETACSQ
jgi:hypothetical protein